MAQKPQKPQKLDIVTERSTLPIRAMLISNNASKLVVFVNGDGKVNDFEEIAMKLAVTRPVYDYLTFFFRGITEGNATNYRDFVQDFDDLLRYIESNFVYTSITIVCTSSGSVATTFALQNPVLEIERAMYLDPADYYFPGDNEVMNKNTWDGSVEYAPNSRTLSDSMKMLHGATKVHVVGFTIRNTFEGSYAPQEERHLDVEGRVPRLNQDMVKAFYDKTPDANKGEYLPVNDVPHAFARDGKIEKNIMRLTEILEKFL